MASHPKGYKGPVTLAAERLGISSSAVRDRLAARGKKPPYEKFAVDQILALVGDSSNQKKPETQKPNGSHFAAESVVSGAADHEPATAKGSVNGKRFTEEKKLQILAEADQIGASKAGERHDVSAASIYMWRKRLKDKARNESASRDGEKGGGGLQPHTYMKARRLARDLRDERVRDLTTRERQMIDILEELLPHEFK